MEKVKKYTSKGERLDEFSMVFYNNLLSLYVVFSCSSFTMRDSDIVV